MRSEYFKLVDGQPVPTDQMGWAESWRHDRIVAKTKLGDSEVSTVFIGLNHAFGSGPPMIYETMVFGGVLDQECEHYSTPEEARAGHEAMCDRVNLSRAAQFAFADE